MPERPLLIFPEPQILPREKQKGPPIPPGYHIPGFERQKDRLTPQFESMFKSFITDSPGGIEPEYVLVLETVGKIEDFERAVRAIKGLEWLAEIDSEELRPDDDYFQKFTLGKRFFSEKIDTIDAKQSKQIWEALEKNDFIDKHGYITGEPVENVSKYIPSEFSEVSKEITTVLKEGILGFKDKLLSGRLFLSMSNRQAMNELLNLWRSWDDPQKRFKRGYGKWKEIFKQLKTIRPWDTRDRLIDTGVLEFWQEELEIKKGTASKINFEIELWYRRDAKKREDAQDKIERLIVEEKGNIIAACEIDSIRFHSLKAQLPPGNIEKILDHEYTKLFTSQDVMFFRPQGQCTAEKYPEGEIGEFPKGTTSGEPVVAILDGAPFVNHTLLENRLVFDDPDDFSSDYLADERKHGTAMASLICHGELDANEPPLSRPVYIRPIMKPDKNDINSPRREHIPDNIFMEDIIERSVRRLFEGENHEPAVAPGVKVINISVGDASRMFLNNQLSPSARLLDWLSYEYQVLFCVSAGNIKSQLKLDKNEMELKSFPDEELIRHTMSKIDSDIRNRRLIAPAESINSITVGALHSDRSNPGYIGNRIDILPTDILPSPISAHGHGFRVSIKPEIYMPGGKQLYSGSPVNTDTYAIDNSTLAPGQKVATTPVTPGETNRCVYTRGTSNSAALASRGAAQIFEVLDELRKESNYNIPEEKIAVLLKTLLAHSASWGESHHLLEKCLKNNNNARQFKKTVSRYLGFGVPNIQRVLECTAQRATAIGFGEIKKDEKHEFRLPLPTGLSGSREMRRLIITLAWFSPVNPDNRKFRKANLSYEPPPREKIGVSRKEADWKQVKNGTIHHEILEGTDSIDYGDDEQIVIPVVCRDDAGTLDEPVHYGLAVTLEVSENIDIQVYEEIKDKLKEQIKIQDEDK
jgi:hypothetical protein